MTTEERRALLDRAITTYGASAQMDMAVEEMAELTKALCKIIRAQAGCEVTAAIGNVSEEMADVQIMLDQLRIIFHRSTEEVEEAKLERLKNRLDGRNNWQGSSLHKWIEKQFSTGGDGHDYTAAADRPRDRGVQHHGHAEGIRRQRPCVLCTRRHRPAEGSAA